MVEGRNTLPIVLLVITLQPHRSLDIMMPPAQWLPVASIPEQPHVATVRYNVINHSRRCSYTLLITVCAERMSAQV